MEVITGANPQLGFSKIKIRYSNYPQKLGISFRLHERLLDVRRNRRIALVKANSGGVIEKEHEFKPSFDEYLKAMESVKSRRKKRNDSPPSPSPKYGEETVHLGDFQQQTTVEKVVKLKEKWTREKLYTNETLIPARVRAIDTNGVREIEAIYGESQEQSSKMKRDSETGSNLIDVSMKKKKSPKNGEGTVNLGDFQQQITVEKEVKLKEEWTREKLYPNEALIPSRVRATDTNGVRETGAIYGRSQGQSSKMKRDSETGNNLIDVSVKKKSSHVKNQSGTSDVLLDDGMGIEREAFKSMEEFNDVCDQPRVSRVDMEERIQTLARCLNGAPVDTPEWNFSKMMRSAKIRFADYSMIRLIQILGKYGNWRRVLQVIEWIQSRERFKSHKIRHIFTAALDVLKKARRPVEALNLFNAMQQHMSSYPDLVAYHCVAVTLGQAGHLKELFHVIDTMKSPPKKKLSTGVLQKWDPRLEPDIIVYNAVLNACVHRKNWEGAFWVLQQLKQQCQQPTSTTYGLVMEVMLECGKFNLVHEFFRKMQKSYIPNSLTYKVLLNTLWREGKVEEAVLAVEEMERRGIIGSSGLYYDLARCLCSAGRCQEALMQMEKICKVATKPLVVTYTGLIQACLESGNIENGMYIFNHMLKFCSPHLVTYNIMLKGYVDHRMFLEARKLFEKLLDNGKKGVTSRYMVLPDIHTFNLMLEAYFENHRWDDLELVYTSMLQHGYYFNAKRHSRMVLDATRAGKVKLLETTWKHLTKGNQVPPSPLVKEMFILKLEQDDYAAAFSCVASIPCSELPNFSSNSWLCLFQDNPQLFRKEKVLRLIDEMNASITRGETSNMIILNIMKSCNELLRIK